MKISVGPILYYWPKQQVLDFYQRLLDSSVDIIYLGEAVCSKRHELRIEFPDATVRCEVGGVDVLLETDQTRVFFEVKSELCTRRVIREALGQIMEYAYYQPHGDARDIRLVVVGRSSASDDDLAYLALLNKKFGIPVAYRQVTIDPLF